MSRKGFQVIDPNAKVTAPKPRIDAKPLVQSPAMQAVLDRARQAQPPISTMGPTRATGWRPID